jgi:hypothetical protein
VSAGAGVGVDAGVGFAVVAAVGVRAVLAGVGVGCGAEGLGEESAVVVSSGSSGVVVFPVVPFGAVTLAGVVPFLNVLSLRT